MAKQFSCLPSQVLRIEDEYTAYCFDEACSVILAHLMNDENPTYEIEDLPKEKPKHFTNMKDFYNSLGV